MMHALRAVADTHPEIIRSIVRIAPVSGWLFVRLRKDGIEGEKHVGGMQVGAEKIDIKKQLHAQGNANPIGSSIMPICVDAGQYHNGLSLLFADKRERFGILLLLRMRDLGMFTSSEVRLLTFALHAASDRFSEARLMESQGSCMLGSYAEESLEKISAHGKSDSVVQYLLNRNFEVILSWNGDNERRLPACIEEVVRKVTAGWTEDPASWKNGFDRPFPFLVVRTQPMFSGVNVFIGVTLEYKKRYSLAESANRFGISPRETQVLALLLKGGQVEYIAEQLAITCSTVQDHIKALLRKTDTQNRSEMIAKALGFDTEMISV